MGTFSNWLQQQQHRDDEVGDLARDFSAAVSAGIHASNFETPEALLGAVSAMASPGAHRAILQAGQEMRKS